jgi:amino acid transporter
MCTHLSEHDGEGAHKRTSSRGGLLVRVQTSESPPQTATRPPAPLPLLGSSQLPETLGYRIKNRLLGPPLTSEQLGEQRLSKVAALGVLSPDCISSTAYGSEEILRILVPAVGVAAFTLLLPVTLAIIVVLFFVTLSYREVVMAYQKTGGSYMVSRENFGPKIAQIAAAALIIDYSVTVAVQVAAGTSAIASALPALGPYSVELSVVVVLLMAYGNLRGLREASKIFAFPTYLFIVTMGAMIVVGLVRAAIGHLAVHSIHVKGAVPIGHAPDAGLLMGASVFVLLKAFANGGSSLTGLEAISNGVSAFKPPAGRNARRTLVVMSVTLGSLVVGVSLLARLTHAVPYASGYPTVVLQEASEVFGGHNVAYWLIVVANVAILYTGGNTSFNGFPFLASFVAQDSFLPRWLTKRGHRLAFSNGIIVLTVVGCALLIASGANVDSLVAVYAIGVFTGFTMAGAGMVRYHRRNRERGWQYRQLINGFAAVLTAAVVVIFAVTKFTQGAWLVVVLFPVLVFWFIRINRRYQREEGLLAARAGRAGEAPPARRHTVVLLVDRLDLATVTAVRYAKSLHPDSIRVVNFRTDPAQTRELEERWRSRGMTLPLEVLDCPDRRVGRATLDLLAPILDGETQVSVLLPRRDFSGIQARLLHDRTAERISLLLSEVRDVTPIIVPFQLTDQAAGRRLAIVAARRAKAEGGSGTSGNGAGGRAGRGGRTATVAPPAPVVPGRVPIGELSYRRRAKVAGVIKSVEIQPRDGIQVLTARLEDESGAVNLVFGRGRVDGIEPSARLVAEGMVGEYDGALALRNPEVEFLARAQDGE